MKNLLELKKYEVFELLRDTFDKSSRQLDVVQVQVRDGSICGGIGSCEAFTVQGAYETLREDIECCMHDFVDTNECDKVYISPMTKADGYQNVYIVVASIRKASDPDSKIVEEFIIVEGDKMIPAE